MGVTGAGEVLFNGDVVLYTGVLGDVPKISIGFVVGIVVVVARGLVTGMLLSDLRCTVIAIANVAQKTHTNPTAIAAI